MITRLIPAESISAGVICDREGQVLSAHAAPFGLAAGDYLADRLASCDRRFLAALPPDADAVLLLRRRPVLCRRAMFAGLLWLLVELDASPAALAAARDYLGGIGIACAPSLLRVPGDASPEACTAAVGQIARNRFALACAVSKPIAEIFAQLAVLPPLCGRAIALDALPALPVGGDWPILLYCMCIFLCRGSAGAPIRVSCDGTPVSPVLLLSSAAPTALPAGRCSLAALSLRLPDLPELSVAAGLAARSGIEAEVFSAGDGCLCFCAAEKHDPARLGFKLPDPLNAAAGEAAEAEWCRLLRGVLQAAE